MQISTTGKRAGQVRLNETEKRKLTESARLLHTLAPHMGNSEELSEAANEIEALLLGLKREGE